MAKIVIDIIDALDWHEGLPLPKWDLLSTWVEARFEEADHFEAWTEVARDWLRHLSDATEGGYVFTETPHTLVFGANDPAVLRPIARTADSARHALLAAMPGLAEFRGLGKQIVLAWAHRGDYYRYISAYDPEDGQFGASAGMHIRVAYPHIAVHHVRGDQTAVTVAHEMTHAALSHLQLPQWIEEGMAQTFERDHSGQPARLYEPAEANKCRRYWQNHGLEAFWTGESFHALGKAQRHSYELAEILVRNLFSDHSPSWFGFNRAAQRRLHAFLRAAQANDAGQSAAEEHLGQGLEALAARFLGPGDWAPPL